MTRGGTFEDSPPSELTPRDYAIFLVQLRALLNWIVERPDILSPVRREELRASISDISGSLDWPISGAPPESGPVNRGSMMEHQLDGPNGRMKLGGWWRARDRFYDWMNRKNARRALRWANPILDSMSAIAPILKPVQEVVQVTENLIEDAAHEAGED